MSVTNEEIMEKLNKIESMLSKIGKEEEQELKTIESSNINLEYTNPSEWQQYLWEGCEFRKEKEGSEEIDFWCTKQDKPCQFDGCPLNVKS